MRSFVLLLVLTTFSSLSYSKEKGSELTSVKCYYSNVLTGKTVSHWAVTTESRFLKIEGVKNAAFYDTSENRQLISEYCLYTNRVHHEEDGILFKPLKITAKAFRQPELELRFVSESPYPKGLEKGWHKKVAMKKQNNNKWQNIAVKSATTLASLVGASYFIKTASAESATRFLSLLGIVPFVWSTTQFILDQDLSVDDTVDMIGGSKDFLGTYRKLHKS